MPDERKTYEVARTIPIAAILIALGLGIGILVSLLMRPRSDTADRSTSVSTSVVPGTSGRQVGSGSGESSTATRGTSSTRDTTAATVAVTGPVGGAVTTAVTGSPAQRGIAGRTGSNLPLILDCDSAFNAADTHESLVDRYGASAVTSERVDVGEGHMEPGSVLFTADSSRRAIVMWNDTANRRNPRMVAVMRPGADGSRWQTRDGITIGTDLLAIEKLNQRPFTLLGFGWDYSGTVMAWENGQLEDYNSATCDVRMRLAPADPSLSGGSLMRQVLGERSFSSSHPAMQRINPRVYELFVQFKATR